MRDLEQQLERLATAVLERVPPVDVAEVVDRRPASSRRRLAVVALGVAAAVTVVAAVLIVRRDDRAEVDTIAPPGGTSWVDLLAMVPDTPAARDADLHIADWARARHLLGRRPPGPDAPAAEVEADRHLVSAAGELGQHGPAEVRAELGFDSRVFDQEVSWGVLPARADVVRGSFDRGAIARAVATDPIWSPLLEEREYEGVPFWSWGEDYELNDRFSGLRGPGQSARLALVDDVVVWARGDAELEQAVEVMAGRVATLADDPHFRRAAEEADRHAVVWASVTTGDAILRRRAESGGEPCAPSPCDPPLLPAAHVPAVWLAGVTVQADGDRQGIALLVYPDEDAAAAALEAVRTHATAVIDQAADEGTDGERLPLPEVSVVDRVVVVVGAGAHPM